MEKIKFGGLGTIVFIVLLILKLTGTSAISWFWVFFPLWIGLAIGGTIWLIVMIVSVSLGIILALWNKIVKV